MTKIFLSGPISGAKDYKERFLAAEFFLEKIYDEEVSILNPAMNPDGLRPADYMRLSFAMIDAADVISVMPGWANSRGAVLEVMYALYIDKPVLETYTGREVEISSNGGVPVFLSHSVGGVWVKEN